MGTRWCGSLTRRELRRTYRARSAAITVAGSGERGVRAGEMVAIDEDGRLCASGAWIHQKLTGQRSNRDDRRSKGRGKSCCASQSSRARRSHISSKFGRLSEIDSGRRETSSAERAGRRDCAGSVATLLGACDVNPLAFSSPRTLAPPAPQQNERSRCVGFDPHHCLSEHGRGSS